jgi:pyruvyltransferase
MFIAETRRRAKAVLGSAYWTLRESSERVASAISGTILRNRVGAYWYKEEVNFGDLLTPLLLKSYGLNPFHQPPNRATVVSTGSILELVPTEYRGWVLGSRLTFDQEHPLRNATVLATRGDLTRRRIHAPKNIVLGDPGLLADRLITGTPAKSLVLGIIPHYLDFDDSRIALLAQKHGTAVCVIDVRARPRSVLRHMAKCEFILSSSLHGLICADALGIPRAWTRLSDKVKGKGFKFADYGSAIGDDMKPLPLSGTEALSELTKACYKPASAINETKGLLDEAFRDFSSTVRERRFPFVDASLS